MMTHRHRDAALYRVARTRESLRRDKALRRGADESSSQSQLAAADAAMPKQKSHALPKQKKPAGLRSLEKEKIHGSQRKPA